MLEAGVDMDGGAVGEGGGEVLLLGLVNRCRRTCPLLCLLSCVVRAEWSPEWFDL